ncbi:MAG: response regulator [Verrucomicrobiales bacterium]
MAFFRNPANSLSSTFLRLFDLGAFSFWQWTSSNNELATFGALRAESLEDWMTRIHPRDQAGFSAFIDKGRDLDHTASSIEYRFDSNRQRNWIRVRQTASPRSQDDGENSGSLVCLIEELPPQGEKTMIETLEERVRSQQAPHKAPSTKIFPGFITAKALAARLDMADKGETGDHHLIPHPEDPVPTIAPLTFTSTAADRKALEITGLKGSTILLVEDEAAVRKLVRKLLEMLGCSVIEAPSGRQALTLWPEIKDRISLVVSDIVMPEGISGWDLAKELHHRHPALPILLTSGYSEFAEDHDIINHPRIAFLQKPYQIKTLRNTLCRLKRETVNFSQHQGSGT